ncbi:iron chelate uptake ABC transporter family permease subunit, partial [Roseospira navarrensis]
ASTSTWKTGMTEAPQTEFPSLRLLNRLRGGGCDVDSEEARVFGEDAAQMGSQGGPRGVIGARAFVGALSRGVILLSALIGAILLLTSNLAAHVLLSPQEHPVGIVISQAGAILVAVLLIRRGG